VKTHFLTVSAMTLAGVCVSAPAFAQGGSMRPYASLFGGAGTAPGLHQNLDVTLSAAEAYDDNRLADVAGGMSSAASPLQRSGFYTGLDGALRYDWTGQRVQFAANGASNLRYYADTHELVPVNYGGGLGLSVGFARRSRLFVNQSVSYSPSLFYSVLPALDSPAVGNVVGAGSDLSVAKQNGYVSDTTTKLSLGVTARSTMTLLGDYQYSTFAVAPGVPAFRSYSAGGQYAYTLSRDATLHLGYVRREAGSLYSGDGHPVVEHDIDAGVDYHRALSFSRRTRIDFNVGSALVGTPTAGGAGQPLPTGSSGPLQYRVIGSGGLSQDFGRTWKARVSYNRGVGYLEAFRQPIFSDALNLGLAGFFSRRVDFSASGGMSLGNLNTAYAASGASAAGAISQNQFRTYTASAKLRYAFASRWATYAEYVFYNYGAGAAVVLPAGVPGSLERNIARAGITWWLPVVKR
jgi:hypothetical protein